MQTPLATLPARATGNLLLPLFPWAADHAMQRCGETGTCDGGTTAAPGTPALIFTRA